MVLTALGVLIIFSAIAPMVMVMTATAILTVLGILGTDTAIHITDTDFLSGSDLAEDIAVGGNSKT